MGSSASPCMRHRSTLTLSVPEHVTFPRKLVADENRPRLQLASHGSPLTWRHLSCLRLWCPTGGDHWHSAVQNDIYGRRLRSLAAMAQKPERVHWIIECNQSETNEAWGNHFFYYYIAQHGHVSTIPGVETHGKIIANYLKGVTNSGDLKVCLFKGRFLFIRCDKLCALNLCTLFNMLHIELIRKCVSFGVKHRTFSKTWSFQNSSLHRQDFYAGTQHPLTMTWQEHWTNDFDVKWN